LIQQGAARNRSPRRACIGLLLTLAWVADPAPVAAQWRVEAWFGTAFNAGSPLTIHQADQPDIRMSANWSTRPWTPTWYYAGRVAKWSGPTGFAFEFVHHKIYLDNPSPPDVARFQVTNGVNQLILERLWRTGGWEYGVGVGPVFAVPISEIRGQTYDRSGGTFGSKYEFGGGVLAGNLARRLKLLPFTYGSLSVKATISYLNVNVAEGNATTMNYALHFQYGLSLQSKP